MGYLLAIDQGTTSTRAIVFGHDGVPVATEQLPHAARTPAPGWVEHDGDQIWRNTCTAVDQALASAGIGPNRIDAVGIANQRETTIVWDRRDGRPIGPAIGWQDVRTAPLVDRVENVVGRAELRRRTGLGLSTYFSVTKLMWLLKNVPGARRAAAAGHLLFGTVDSWLLWNLTGGPSGGTHATDATNASRTALMDIRTRTWDGDLLDALDIPRSLMPEIRPSAGLFAVGDAAGPVGGAPVTALVGDQQASLYAHGIAASGAAKCTYGTGGFVMMHTGEEPVRSDAGLITTIAFEQHGQRPTYALEGSIAVAGALLQWLRDGLEIISHVTESEGLARAVDDNGGVVLVPAFSGLYAPHWAPDARGTIVGLTAYANRRHVVRAALEAIAHQVADVVAAAERDSGMKMTALRADGGAAANPLLLQIQADLLGVPVHRARMLEMTAFGAAVAAGVGAELWADRTSAPAVSSTDAWQPGRDGSWRATMREQWMRALNRSLGWVA